MINKNILRFGIYYASQSKIFMERVQLLNFKNIYKMLAKNIFFASQKKRN